MNLKNFRTETDPDGIALLTWDMPGRSMNVLNAEVIGEIVMEHLRTLDDVAYVRFASVYRNFREAKDFEAVLGELSGDDAARIALLRK